MDAADLLRMIDSIRRDLELLHSRVADLVVEGEREAADDLAEHNMLSVRAASERWNIPEDTLRSQLRNDGTLGVKRGGVWSVSAPRFVRRLRRG